MQTATATETPMMTAQQKRTESARQLGREGYAISELARYPGIFEVRKPGRTTPYAVDLSGATPTCSCPDFEYRRLPSTVCKHIVWVRQCLNYAASLPVSRPEPVRPVRRRRFYSPKRLATLRRLVPTMAPAKASKIVTPTPEFARRMNEDF